ncbi:uncharacterized protein LOC127855578 [Dreissena polymorpha]|uniref:Methyltransferase FkbM domain-containing protein n=1 Tax=Dreissena polymorpha TaxID=45954 RepID=A0A9D4CCM3_DREPO|nr:uncharacterized protein LOC127855578 [Dreissena polymorpha]XP_052247272.1 uncharacterized protein LOC127855578 [Dreissena polymorpha]KAH3721126.1 hypothetical protein DPMN_064043 [Dreissena polymorpha]
MIAYLLKRNGLSLIVAFALIAVALVLMRPQYLLPWKTLGTLEEDITPNRKPTYELNISDISKIQTELLIASVHIDKGYSKETAIINGGIKKTYVTHMLEFASITIPSKLSSLVRIFDSKKMSLNISVAENKCVNLRIRSDLQSPICVYDKESDNYISGSLLSSGTWEGAQMAMVVRLLQAHSEVDVLDLGCNIGVYTILAAKMNHRVVSVDPSRKNLMLLSRSLKLGQIDSKVTLLWNAVGDRVQNVTLHDYKGNIGGTFVKAESVKDDENKIDESHRAVAVTLDHLIPLFSNKPMFIKIDIETYEWNALKGGERFFKSTNVRFVFMEWVAHRNKQSANDIINFMYKFHLVPHQNENIGSRLQLKSNATWPGEIMWMKIVE